MTRKILGASMLTAAVFLTGCYPDSPDTLSEYDLVYTDRSPSFDFAAATTYSLPDSVVLITGNVAEGELPDMVNPVYGDVIIDRIRQNMNSRGWQEVVEADGPDVILLPSVLKTTNVDVYYGYGGYWGWYYPYGGWYYPGYYPTYTSYTTGSLFLQLNVPGETSPTNNTPVVWLGVINGLLEGSQADITQRTINNIDQAFTQSDYLKK